MAPRPVHCILFVLVALALGFQMALYSNKLRTDGGASGFLQRRDEGPQRAAEIALAAYFKVKPAVIELARTTYERAIAAGATANSAYVDGYTAAIAQLNKTLPKGTVKDVLKVRGCPVLDHTRDLDKTIMEVSAEHPGEDLFCHFAKHVMWFGGSEVFFVFHSYVMTHEALRQIQTGFSGVLKPDGTGPLVTFHMEGLPSEGITAHIDGSNYVYDDLYCYQLGFLQNMGLAGKDVFDDGTWGSIARRWCEKAAKEFSWSDEELTIRNHLDRNPVILAGATCAAGLGPEGCRPVTRRMFVLHAYQKCLLGDEAPEMAYCYARGCLLGNHIGHFRECD